MKLRTKYILFIALIELSVIILASTLLKEHKLLFVAAEAFILLSIILSLQLYKQFIQPIHFLVNGVEAIREKDFSAEFLYLGNAEMDKLITVYNQMIRELRKERVAQEQQYRFLEKLIEMSPSGIVILDFDDRIQSLNPKMQSFLEIDGKDLIGKPIDEVIHPILTESIRLQQAQSRIINVNGSGIYRVQKSHFVDRGFSRSFLVAEELSSEILAAEKSAYSKVIRIMAHEVNNTIGPVNSILESTLKLQPNAPAIENALQVAIDRNNNLNLFMRNYAELVRIPDPQKKDLDLTVLIGNVIQLIRSKITGKEIRFIMEGLGQEFRMEADAQQLEQVFINIFKNAVEAISESGYIRVELNHSSRELSIIDSGRGITDEQQKKLFSPFFSTKKDGQGLGLTLVREILSNHRFNFSLKSLNGVTEFKVRFI